MVLCLGVLFLFPNLASSGFTNTPKKNTPPFTKKHISGELLVKYKHWRNPMSSRPPVFSTRWHGRLLRRFERLGVHRVKIRKDLNVEEALAACRQDPEVAYAEPNYVRSLSAIPNDTDFDLLWGLDNTGQTGGVVDADIDAVEAWDIQTGNTDVVVAVIDTGVDLDHDELAENILLKGNGDYHGWDFANDDAFPDDDNGHGSHVSGIIGAKGDNGLGVVGVTWSVSIMPLKILDAAGSGTVADEIEAIEYAINHGAHIINASYSGPTYSVFERDAIEMAKDAGILFVAAAGNKGYGNEADGWNNDEDGQQIYPAGYDLENIVAVAATDHHDSLAGFSNYGPLSVDVAGPGASVLSAYRNNQFKTLSGTSMATPHVSGLAALIWAEDIFQNGSVTLSFTEVRNRICNGVDVLPALSGRILMAGRINAYQSLVTVDPLQRPASPSGLDAQAISSNVVQLTWTDESGNESGFKVVRAQNPGGPYAHVGTAAENVSQFTDNMARDGSVNYYAVLAFNGHGDSAESLGASATTPLAAPTDLTAVAVSTGTINLSWTDHSAVETGYEIEEKAGPGGSFSLIVMVGAGEESYTRTGLDPAVHYTYRIRATAGGSFSAYSNEASATTQASSGATGGTGSSGSGGGPTSAGSDGGGCFITSL
jgi:subtilisin family serine protease